MASVPNETQPLLAEDEAAQNKQPTPLPKLQISILMLLLLAEPVTSHCIYPFINQVSTYLRQISVRYTDLTRLQYSWSASSTLQGETRKKSATMPAS